MDVQALLERVRSRRDYAGQLEHIEEIPERAGSFVEVSPSLPESLQGVLTNRGIDRLYSHQGRALEAARHRRDLVVVTGTASGKTLCYNLPILESAIVESNSRALYLYPTKALAQDQLKGLQELVGKRDDLREAIRPGVYDGDTPNAQRRRIRNEANLVLSNPDMLHASILPYHPKWADFFTDLRYVVIDEVHTYRGILGAHVSAVLRRLLRVCRHYGSAPIFLATSATIANPGELVERLIGREVEVIDDDGSPRGRKYFALWNPSPLGADSLARRSANDDAVMWLEEAVEAEGQALAFTRTRQAAELVYRYLREALDTRRSRHAGDLRAVATTNALELARGCPEWRDSSGQRRFDQCAGTYLSRGCLPS
jgi:DEAD/DEAH box helicase domain-containing protein